MRRPAQPLYQLLASCADAARTCATRGNAEWMHKHTETIDALVREHMPSGSGFDSGTTFDHAASSDERLVFVTSFHHMNDVGMYDGWTEHTVTARASLALGFTLRVSGRNRNDIKDYIAETFSHCLSMQFEPDMDAGCYRLVRDDVEVVS